METPSTFTSTNNPFEELERPAKTTHPTTPQYGLIGYPLAHSFSPGYFAQKFAEEGIAASYEAYPLEEISDLPGLLRAHAELKGLNVTTPHKQAVLPYLQKMSADARAIGAVNCIDIRGSELIGHNTDWTAFRDSLKPLLQAGHMQALVLGGGGASLGVKYALQQLGIGILNVSRRAGADTVDYGSLSRDILQEYRLVVNTTSLGTLGEGLPPIPYEHISSEHLFYDLVYNPALTPFLAKAKEKGAAIKNGIEMLHLQAEASWQIWQGTNA